MAAASPRQGRFVRLDPFTSGRVAMTPATLTFGRRAFAPDDVQAVRIESGEKASFIGSVCAFAIFLGLAAIIMGSIVAQVFPSRTLIGVITLGCVGLASLQDSWRERGDGFYSLFVTTAAAGEVMVFATSDRNEMEQVRTRLAEFVPATRFAV